MNWSQRRQKNCGFVTVKPKADAIWSRQQSKFEFGGTYRISSGGAVSIGDNLFQKMSLADMAQLCIIWLLTKYHSPLILAQLEVQFSGYYDF
jgi:hypothetical protein